MKAVRPRTRAVWHRTQAMRPLKQAAQGLFQALLCARTSQCPFGKYFRPDAAAL